MSNFKFKLRDRVNVPDLAGVQGVVSMRSETIAGQNKYFVDWLSASSGNAGSHFTETELTEANAPEPAPVSVSELKTAIVQLSERRPSARKPAKKPARKSKRK